MRLSIEEQAARVAAEEEEERLHLQQLRQAVEEKLASRGPVTGGRVFRRACQAAFRLGRFATKGQVARACRCSPSLAALALRYVYQGEYGRGLVARERRRVFGEAVRNGVVDYREVVSACLASGVPTPSPALLAAMRRAFGVRSRAR